MIRGWIRIGEERIVVRVVGGANRGRRACVNEAD